MSEPVLVVVPQVNPNDEHAVLVRWHVESGSQVVKGATLATLETTKATFDVQSPCDGFAFHDVEPNTLIAVGSTIARLTLDGKPPSSEKPEALADSDARTEARFTRKALRRMKDLGLTQAHFAGSGRVDLAEVERIGRERSSDRAAGSEGERVGRERSSDRGAGSKVERIGCEHSSDLAAGNEVERTAREPSSDRTAGSEGERIGRERSSDRAAGSKVERIGRERSNDRAAGSEGERIGREHSSDRVAGSKVERIERERSSDGVVGSEGRGGSVTLSRTPGSPPSERRAQLLQQNPAKIIEARTLAEVYHQAVPSSVSVAVSVEKTAACLQRLSTELGPISLLERTIHEAAGLLADYPELNGFYADGRAWRHEVIAVGFAINLGKSLRVPVVRDTATLSQLEVARAVRDLSLRYLRDELQLQDLADGTFTISDLSSYGVAHFVPVLNHRQAATLGICAERAGTGFFELVLTFDHRMADGMRAAQFLSELRARIETDSVPN
jgi:pyruvate/2-oxoglutarate dehydrogenase complex dihydrolipoamide acyltransferase (E2) component